MTVRELNEEQMENLKRSYVFEKVRNPSSQELADSIYIPDEVIYKHYDGINFVEEDFNNR